MLDRPNSLRRVGVFTGKRAGFEAMFRKMRPIDADPVMELKVIASTAASSRGIIGCLRKHEASVHGGAVGLDVQA